MQRATCTGLHIRSPSDAEVIFHAVWLNILPIVTHRLDTEERSSISAGSVYVWEERCPYAEATGIGIERWTDGIRWGPSRVREGFLFYHRKDSHLDTEVMYDSDTSSNRDSSREILIKQTYTVFVDTPRGRRKWHLIAYFTEDSLDYLRCIEDFPNLAYLRVPPGKYKSARSAKGKLHSHANNLDIGSPDFSRQYVPSSPEREARVNVSPTHPSQPTPLCLTWINTPNDHNHHHHHRVCPRPITSSGVPDILAPLAYLQNIPPPTRHPLDEKALKLFTPGLV